MGQPRLGGRKDGKAKKRTLVVCPLVSVDALCQLLIDPCKEARGGVCERVPERLRLRCLYLEVTEFAFAECKRRCDARAQGRIEWSREHFEEEEWMGEQGGCTVAIKKGEKLVNKGR